ncbi:MAG TPA: hypothetical protein VL326_31580, partial [Kofleriaceae bacterium]|nr:hypothetical protein [Kofleriaceae bacterium]
MTEFERFCKLDIASLVHTAYTAKNIPPIGSCRYLVQITKQATCGRCRSPGLDGTIPARNRLRIRAIAHRVYVQCALHRDRSFGAPDMQTVERPPTSTTEITIILNALTALKRGDASIRLPSEWHGPLGRVADVFNDVVERNQRMAHELERLSKVVGKQGKLAKRGNVGEVSGFWATSIDSVNQLIDDLVHPTSETARVIGAVAQGDLSQTMALEVDGEPLQGEFLRTAKTVNTMVDQLGSFA